VSSHPTIYSHSGTGRPADIGPSSGGVLHSITISQPDSMKTGSLIVRDGGRSGKIVCQLDYTVKNTPFPQLKWDGIKIDGQLNVTLGHRHQTALIAMSVDDSTETAAEAPIETSDGPSMETSDEASHQFDLLTE
jgi:hypothetical protein